MKILITTFTFAPQANGVAEVVRAQVNGLSARGHEVTVATHTVTGRTRADFGGAVAVREFHIQGTDAWGSGYSGEVEPFQSYISEFRADLVLCHCWQTWSTDLALPALAGHPARKIMVSHGFSAHLWERQRRAPWGLGQWLRRRPYVRKLPQMLRAFDHIVFLSPRLDRVRFYDHWQLERRGGPPWTAIPNGTYPEQIAERTVDFRQLHALGDAFVVLCVGLYTPGKNQEAALRAFCRAALPNSVLVFIGNESNDYVRHLQNLTRTLLPPNQRARVLFLEKQNRELIRAAYQAADLVILSSKSEVQPLVLLDAMACGKPYLSTDVGCVSELPGGVVVKREANLAEALHQLYAQPERRAELAQQGLAATRIKYHWNTVLEAYDQLLHRVVATPPFAAVPR